MSSRDVLLLDDVDDYVIASLIHHFVGGTVGVDDKDIVAVVSA